MKPLMSKTHFRVEHCDDCFIAGHLIIRPVEPVGSVAELGEGALQDLGKILALGHRIVQNIIKPERIYTLSFCEVLPVLHFHIFPRTASLTARYHQAHDSENQPVNGAFFFDWARKQCQEKDADYSGLQEALAIAFLAEGR